MTCTKHDLLGIPWYDQTEIEKLASWVHCGCATCKNIIDEQAGRFDRG